MQKQLSARTHISSCDTMQFLRSPSPVGLNCHPPGNQLSDMSPTRQLRSGAVRQPIKRNQTQICSAFLPWQRLLQRAPPSDQPPSAQPSAQLAAKATAQQQHADLPAKKAQNSSAGLLRPSATAEEEPSLPPGPVVAGSGGGIFFFWQLGADLRLEDEPKYTVSGAGYSMHCSLHE